MLSLVMLLAGERGSRDKGVVGLWGGDGHATIRLDAAVVRQDAARSACAGKHAVWESEVVTMRVIGACMSG